MPLALIEHASVRIVVPTPAGREVELAPQWLAVEMLAPFDRVGLLDRGERPRILGQFVDVQRHLSALPPGRVHNGPPVGLAVGQLDRVFHGRAAVDRCGHGPLRRVVFDRDRKVAIVDQKLPLRRHQPGRLTLGLHDLVDVHVTPAARRGIDYADRGLTPDEFGDVPGIVFECLTAAGLIVGAGGPPNHVPVHHEMQRRLLSVPAAPDQDRDERSLNRELSRGQRAG